MESIEDRIINAKKRGITKLIWVDDEFDKFLDFMMEKEIGIDYSGITHYGHKQGN